MSYDPADAAIAAMLADNPILLLDFGTMVDQSSGLTSTDGPGTGRSAISLSSNQFTSIQDAAAWDVSAITVECWFRHAASAARTPIVTRDNNARSWVFSILATGEIQAFSNGSTGPVKQSTGGGLDDGAWHQGCWAYEAAGGTGEFVIDGASDSTYTGGGTLPTGSDMIEVGRWPNAAEYWNGDLWVIAIYGEKLSAAQLAAHYNALS